MITPPKVNYLSNKDLLKEIHKSKLSYCEYNKTNYDGSFDAIVTKEEDIFKEETIQKARETRASKIAEELFQAALSQPYDKKPKLSQFKIEDVTTIPIEGLVVRYMTWDHIPLDPTRKRKPKSESEKRAKINFPPFVHFKYTSNNPTEKSHIEKVLVSHSKNG